ncbi:MAG: hypothetical protein Q9223_005897, partial [Gallowayella weberi]
MSAAVFPAERIIPGSSTSSPGLSSPPSPHSPSTHSSVAYPRLPLQSQLDGGGADGTGGVKAAISAANVPAPPKQQRKPRKKKEPDDTNGPKALPKPRRPRAPKGTSAAAIKKEQQKLALATTSDAAAKLSVLGSNQIIPDHHHASPRLTPNSGVPVANPHLPNGKFYEAIHNSTPYSIPSPPRPASGQNYDPIRSATIEPRIVHPQQPQILQPIPPHARVSASTPPRPASHASLSPSIASLLEQHTSTPVYNMAAKRENEAHPMSPSEPKRPRLTPPASITGTAPAALKDIQVVMPQPHSATSHTLSIMDVDSERPTAKPSSRSAADTKKPSGHSSSSHSPKPGGRKEAAIPPLPPGNGLLSSAMLGGGYDPKAPERTAPTVVLHVPLNGDTNKYVNFARLAEEQYGFDALHPRLAAQRERLARVAAAGAALENAHKSGSGRSADEMSVDLSEGEPEADNSNVEMGGMNGNKDAKQSEAEGSEVPGVKRRKKRTMKEDMYDKDDPFVDDAELAFEEQAAATKDGFFVYSGPLVPEGEKANVE